MKTRSRIALWCALAAPISFLAVPPAPVLAQNDAGDLPNANAEPAPENAARAAALMREAILLGEKNIAARQAVIRGAAALLPRLDSGDRDDLTMRWMRLLNASNSRNVISRNVRLDAYESFFESAVRVQAEDNFARRIAFSVPDHAARAGAFLQLSRANVNTDYMRSLEYSALAQTAARQERNATARARALTFVAYRMAQQNTQDTEPAIREAVEAVRALPAGRARDYLLAEIVGASANFDLPMARRIAESIGDENLRGLATARTNISEASQTTLTVATTERISSLAKAAARYDVRAIPILIQLPAQADVLKALSDALPPIYPTARPAISPQLLERMWTYSTTAPEAGASRDELQSRLARLMVLHDLWRGREWGRQLAWRGGRVQVGAFLNDVLKARRSRVRAATLQDLARSNVDGAIRQARRLQNPASRAEALLLIAGQLLG